MDIVIRFLVDSVGNVIFVLLEICRGRRFERDFFLGGRVFLYFFLKVFRGFEGCLDVVAINREVLELLVYGKKAVGLLER